MRQFFKEWLHRHREDAYLAVFTLLLCLVVLAFASPECVHADDELEPAPFKLDCPEPRRCARVAGFWVPSTYMRQLAGDVARLEGLQKQHGLLLGESEAHKRGLDSAMLRVTVLEEQLVSRDKTLAALSRARDDDRRLIEQRTRLAVVMTVIAVVAVGALVTGYTLQKN